MRLRHHLLSRGMPQLRQLLKFELNSDNSDEHDGCGQNDKDHRSWRIRKSIGTSNNCFFTELDPRLKNMYSINNHTHVATITSAEGPSNYRRYFSKLGSDPPIAKIK